jgi:hypothetical protein
MEYEENVPGEALPLEEPTKDEEDEESGIEITVDLGPPYIDEDGSYNFAHSGSMSRLLHWHVPLDKKDAIYETWPPPPVTEDKKYICMYDTYPFDTVPYGFVLRMNRGRHDCKTRFMNDIKKRKIDDEPKNVPIMHSGVFCSPECVLGYIRSQKMNLDLGLTRVFWKNTYGIKCSKHIHHAPPVYFLKRWQPIHGISIEDFRTKFTKVQVNIMDAHMLSNVIWAERLNYRSETEEEKQKRKESYKRHSGSQRAESITRLKSARFSTQNRKQPLNSNPLMKQLLKKQKNK